MNIPFIFPHSNKNNNRCCWWLLLISTSTTHSEKIFQPPFSLYNERIQLNGGKRLNEKSKRMEGNDCVQCTKTEIIISSNTLSTLASQFSQKYTNNRHLHIASIKYVLHKIVLVIFMAYCFCVWIAIYCGFHNLNFVSDKLFWQRKLRWFICRIYDWFIVIIIIVSERVFVYGNKTPTMGGKPNKKAVSPGKIDMEFRKISTAICEMPKGYFLLRVAQADTIKYVAISIFKAVR